MTEKIIKGEFDKLKDRLSNLAATYEDKAYDDAINRLYDRLDDLSDLQHLLFGLELNSEMEV